MKIAINTIPLNSAHKDRGVGYYTYNLIRSLEKDPSLDIQQFLDINEVRDADIIHYPWFDFFFRTLKIKKLLPLVVTIHDTIPLIFPEKYPSGLRGKINFLIQKIVLKKAKAIITDSNSSKLDIIHYLKIDENIINVVPLAQDEDFRVLKDTQLLHVKRKYNLADRFILYVGDANWTKNLPFLIEGFYKLLQDKEFSDVKLVLVGGVFLKKVEGISHPELESLQRVNQLIERWDLKDKVIRPGNIIKEDLIGFFNLATVYVQPSLYEGFGLPILQAFACGTPVISSNKGSLKEVGGDAAVYFDPQNLEQFKIIMSDVLNSQSLQNKLSRLSFKQAEKYSWQNTAEKTKIVYSKTIKKDSLF